MPLLISCQSIAKSFGARPLFENISIAISDGERMGLIGPNGAGKSTLLQILAGRMAPDSGIVAPRKLLRLGFVPQIPEFTAGQTARNVLENALASERIDGHGIDEHERDTLITVTLAKTGFEDDSAEAVTLSGGWRKRLAIAAELVRTPDLLLLDEPTNHLDLDGILWLEKLLKSAPFASVTVSHDRYFLENVATDMAEINRTYPDGLLRVRGNYSEFLDRREQFLEAQSKHQEALKNKVAREVEWLRRGPKARTTKSKARIDAAGVLKEELAAVNARTAQSTAVIDFTATDRKTKRLLVATRIDKSLGGKRIFSGLNITLTPGLRLGLVGANGTGKTTLLRIFAGELEPDSGLLERADNLRTVYFEQHREQLDPALSLRRALCPYGDSVIYQDRPVHVASWARRFLFHNEQLDVPVGRLSGGEKARVVIARLILQPADVLLLDEPTNDLDISTLEVLEDSLLEFTGALVLVTHDRYMLDRVSTMLLGLNGDGSAGAFADYSQWEQFRQSAAPEKAPRGEKPPPAQPEVARKKLGYLESREWENIEAEIASADGAVVSLEAELQDPETARDPKRLQECYEKLQAAQRRADQLYARWAELETKQG